MPVLAMLCLKWIPENLIRNGRAVVRLCRPTVDPGAKPPETPESRNEARFNY